MAKGKTHTLQRGETIIQLAQQNGFRAWQPIWMCDENQALRVQRPNPHVLAPGDKLFIPEKVTADYPCETNFKHTFRVPALTQFFQQTLLDDDNSPLSGLEYELTAGGKSFKGRTDGTGTLMHEIPLSAKTAVLKVTLRDSSQKPLEWKFQIGHLEPVDQVYGFKGRLTNLGYDCGPVNDEFDAKTKQALMDYQRDNRLEATGQPDEATLTSLRDFHDRHLES